MIHYRSGVHVLVIVRPKDTYDWFTCDVWGSCKRTNPPRHMHLRSREIGDPEYLGGSYNIIHLFRKMLDTRRPPVAYEVPLELIAIVEAGRRAQTQRRRVYLEEITGDGPAAP